MRLIQRLAPQFTALIALGCLAGVAQASAPMPLLKTKKSFISSAFCKKHTCKFIAKAPAGQFDQFHYLVDGRENIVIWRVTSDRKRLNYTTEAGFQEFIGRIQGIQVNWYGQMQDRYRSYELASALTEAITGKKVVANYVEDVLNSKEKKLKVNQYAQARIVYSTAPSAPVGTMSYMVELIKKDLTE